MTIIRRGLGKGRQGYYNILPMDSHIHSLSAKGIKTKSYQVTITKQSKPFRKPDEEYSTYDREVQTFKDLKEAKKFIADRYSKISSRQPMFKDTKDGDMVKVGRIYTFSDKEYNRDTGKYDRYTEMDWVGVDKVTKQSVMFAKDINPEELERELSNFTGTEQYHKVSMTPVVATDGVAYLCEKAGAFWLVDAIGSYQGESKFKNEHFQVWILKKDKDGKGAMLSAYRDYSETNPNKYKPLVTQKIPYTDFPLDEIKLYAIDGVVLLPSEY